MLLARILTWFQVAMFLLFGVWGFADPQGLARLSAISLPNSLAVAEFRAFYGGAAMGVAALLFLTGRAGRWQDALWIQIVIYGSIVAGRLIHWVSTGSLEGQTAKLLATEALSAALAWFAPRKLT